MLKKFNGIFININKNNVLCKILFFKRGEKSEKTLVFLEKHGGIGSFHLFEKALFLFIIYIVKREIILLSYHIYNKKPRFTKMLKCLL